MRPGQGAGSLPGVGLIAVFLFGTVDQVILQVRRKVDEVGAVAGDADDEVTILLRILLGLLQGIGVDDVELDVPQLQVAPRADDAQT